MAGDHPVVAPFRPVKLREPPGNVTVRNAVEPIAANLLFRQVFIRQPIYISARRQRVVECGIEDGDLRHLRQVRPRRAICLEIVRIMQRGENAEIVNLLLDLVVDDHGLVESVSSMHNSVTDRVDACDFNLLEDGLERICHPGYALGFSLARTRSEFAAIVSGVTSNRLNLSEELPALRTRIFMQAVRNTNVPLGQFADRSAHTTRVCRVPGPERARCAAATPQWMPHRASRKP